MWMSEVEMKVWIRGRAESLIAPQAASMSALCVRARPQITGPSTSRAIASTASKSPGRGDREAGLDHVDARAGRAAARSRPSPACSARCPATARRPSAWCRRCGPGSRRVRVRCSLGRSWAFLLLARDSDDLVSRGCRAAQRYSPRRGRRRRSARLRERGRPSSAGTLAHARNLPRQRAPPWMPPGSRPEP